MGKRIDVVLLSGGVIFVLEFKVGATIADRDALEQAWDYALDLQNFHETSHARVIAPIVVATESTGRSLVLGPTSHSDKVLPPLYSGEANLAALIAHVFAFAS
ncbi:MAG: hypothetical protein JO041_11375, partial [Acidobacteria bacterium]|nr:hypothetical protein [Acidobacteriota bacterium]